MNSVKKLLPGVLLSVVLAYCATLMSGLIPDKLIGASVLAILTGMALNPIVSRYSIFKNGIGFVAKRILKLAIVLMGASLSFTQVLQVGKYSIVVMVFTLAAAFGGGYILGKMFGINWKLSSLISVGTGICGGSAIAAVAPTINAEDKDVAYAISSIYIFDIIMVIIFPLMGMFFGMSDLGYGLWTGTAVNDTSAVVAAGYAFSDAAGSFAVIVKLTRTLSIIPVVLIFSYINQKIEAKNLGAQAVKNNKIDLKKIFPWFILMFLGVVAIKSIGLIPSSMSSWMVTLSKFMMVMSLGAIGLKTNFSEVAKSGVKPLLHGFLVSILVVAVSFVVQMFLGQI